MTNFLCILISYLLGALPIGLLIARAKGIDLRKVGSGNIGATNVGRALGKPWAFATFFADALKGLIPAGLFAKLPIATTMASDENSLAVLCGVAAIAGHVWPVYLKFKGGKGVATSAGVLVGLAPMAALFGITVWTLLFLTTRFVSLASIGAALAVPIIGWTQYAKSGMIIPLALSGLAILVIAKHRTNIQRLVQGTESRFEKRKKGTSSS